MLEQTLYAALHARSPDGLTPLQRGIAALIVSSVCVAVLATEPEARARAGGLLTGLEIAFGLLFLLEYAVRVWTAGVDPRFAGLRGRARYALRPMSLIDAVAVLPFLLGAAGAETMVLRVLRLAKLFALTKLARYSIALQLIAESLRNRRYELGLTVIFAMLVVLLSSAALYAIEGEAQPEAFGSIPRAAWWSVATLTTVGYGDLVPSTPLGKLLASITAFAGIGLIAMPTGILAAAFSDAFAKSRQAFEHRLDESGPTEADKGAVENVL